MYFLYKETDVRLNHDTKNLINTHTHILKIVAISIDCS